MDDPGNGTWPFLTAPVSGDKMTWFVWRGFGGAIFCLPSIPTDLVPLSVCCLTVTNNLVNDEIILRFLLQSRCVMPAFVACKQEFAVLQTKRCFSTYRFDIVYSVLSISRSWFRAWSTLKYPLVSDISVLYFVDVFRSVQAWLVVTGLHRPSFKP